jgi:hypothetical protein
MLEFRVGEKQGREVTYEALEFVSALLTARLSPLRNLSH